MQEIFQSFQKKTWRVAGLTSLFYIVIANALLTPLFNSGDDTFLMYILGGGFGERSSHLLHYSHEWNFTLGWFISSLFKIFPGINWFSIFILFMHWVGLSCLLYTLIRRQDFVKGMIAFFLLFLFIGTRQLLSLTFTGAALTGAIGAMSLLTHQFSIQELRSKNTGFAIALLILSGLLRLPPVLLALLLYAPLALCLFKRKQILFAGVLTIAIAGLLWGANQLHEQYYNKKIPGWNKQEKYRQALFYAYNRPLREKIPPEIFSDSTEQQLFFAGFLYDTARFNTARIEKIAHAISGTRSFSDNEHLKGLYWFFQEVRIYLALLLVCIVFLLLRKKKLVVLKWLLCLGAVLAVHVYLFLFQKITMPIHLGILLFLFNALFLLEDKNEKRLNNTISLFTGASLVLLSGWMMLRLYKENMENKSRYAKFLCATSVLKGNQDKLFIATDDAFPLNYFYIWNLPQNYPAGNLLYKDRLINASYFSTVHQFGITDIEKEIAINRKILLVGSALPALEKSTYPGKLSEPLPGYGCLQVRQLTARP